MAQAPAPGPAHAQAPAQRGEEGPGTAQQPGQRQEHGQGLRQDETSPADDKFSSFHVRTDDTFNSNSPPSRKSSFSARHEHEGSPRGKMGSFHARKDGSLQWSNGSPRESPRGGLRGLNQGMGVGNQAADTARNKAAGGGGGPAGQVPLRVVANSGPPVMNLRVKGSQGPLIADLANF